MEWLASKSNGFQLSFHGIVKEYDDDDESPPSSVINTEEGIISQTYFSVTILDIECVTIVIIVT